MVQFQKLTRNLFLTLQTGKTYTVSSGNCPSFSCATSSSLARAYCGAVGPVSKMASQQEKAFRVLRFEVSRSVITVQREFRARFRKDAPCTFYERVLKDMRWLNSFCHIHLAVEQEFYIT